MRRSLLQMYATLLTLLICRYIVPPAAMEFVPSPVEVEIGQILDLPLAIYGEVKGVGRKMYADCRTLGLRVVVADGSVVTHQPGSFDLIEGSCTSIRISGLKRGHTEITAHYEEQGLKLSASLTVAAYHKLQPIDPEHLAVVAVGSLKEIVFQGGPAPWILNPNKYYQTVAAENNDVVRMKHLRGFGAQKNLHIFRVLCMELGDQDISISVGNGVTSKNMFPASATASVRFICAQPVGLHLTPQIKHPDIGHPCPLFNEHTSTEAIPVHSNQDLYIDVVVTDSNGFRFDNFSSLALDWEISNAAVASLSGDVKLTTEVSEPDMHRRVMTYTQVVHMADKLGQLSITARVKRYRNSYFTQQQIDYQETIEPSLVAILDLLSVQDAVINPDSVSIFNHPSNKVKLQITGGSGYFHIEYGNMGKMASVNYDDKHKIVHISPLLDGSFVVTAHDLCLFSTLHPAHSNIHVSGVSSISVKVVDKVELHKMITAEVRVYDHQGALVEASYFSLMDLTPQTASDIISLKQDSHHKDRYSARYIITGVSLGRVMLHYTAKPTANTVIKSQPKEIQVFPPLRLEPRNITLIIGAMFQITAYGGPQPQSTIEFSLDNDAVALISHNGLVDSKDLGQTVVTGRAVGYEADTGELIVYSQDSVVVHVVQLSGIRIHAPLKRLQTATKMPLYAIGMNEYETPFMFASVVPPLQFHWSIDNKEAVELRNVFYESGLPVSSHNQFSVLLFAHHAGQVNVKLEVRPAKNSRYIIRDGYSLVDELQIKVFERLKILPSSCDKTTTCTILMTPNTDAHIRTNRDGAARMAYKILTSPTPSVYADGALDLTKPIVSVSDSGLIHAGARTGQLSVLVTAHEDFGVNQTTLIHVQVKLVSYLMLNSDSVFSTAQDTTINSIPVGAPVYFTVTYHDDIGARFTATNTVLKYRPSRFDLLHVHSGAENSTLVARTINAGETVLKVWSDDNPSMSDYINIVVGHEITPTPDVALTLGDVVCYRTPLRTNTGAHGIWTSNSRVVTIASSSGIAVATRIGTDLLYYNASDRHTLVTNTQVEVRAITQVTLNSQDIAYLSSYTSDSNDASYFIPVRLSSGDAGVNIDSQCRSMLLEHGLPTRFIPFRCELSMTKLAHGSSVNDLFTATPTFDLGQGVYGCNITPSRRHDLAKKHSLTDGQVSLRARVTSDAGPTGGQMDVLSAAHTWPYLPSYFLFTSELQISNLMPVTSIRLQATDAIIQDITVTVSDASLLELQASERDAQSPHIIHYPVRLIVSDALWDMSALEAQLHVHCSSTGQLHTIPVRIKLVGPKPSTLTPGQQSSTSHDTKSTQGGSTAWHAAWLMILHNYQTWIFMILATVITIAALIIAYHTVLGSRYQVASQPGVFLQPGQTPSRDDSNLSNPWTSPYNHSRTSPGGSTSGGIHLWTSNTDISLLRKSPSSSPYH